MAGFRRLFRCAFEDGQLRHLHPAEQDDYGACAAFGYKVVSTKVVHPQANAVISLDHPEKRHLAARFEGGDIRILLHPEAVVGRSLADAEADELLDWSGIAAENDDDGIIVKLAKVSPTAR
jgi:hypothetical protein